MDADCTAVSMVNKRLTAASYAEAWECCAGLLVVEKQINVALLISFCRPGQWQQSLNGFQ
jgi:hypothetical protein